MNKYADETRDRVAKKRIKAAGAFPVKLGQKSDESVSSGEPAALNPHRSPADGAQRQAGAPGARHRAHATISIWSLPRIRDGDYLKQHLFLRHSWTTLNTTCCFHGEGNNRKKEEIK